MNGRNWQVDEQVWPSIAIVGAGALGAYYGGRLAQAGRDVHFLLRSDYEVVRQKGWEIQSADGDFVLPPESINVYRDSREMPKVDLVIVTLKATSNGALKSLIEPLLHRETSILTLQNGLGNEELLAGHFGAERVMGGLAFVCINRIGPGMIHHMDHGKIRVGEFIGGPTLRVEKVARMFRESKVECEVLDNLKYGRWLKLVWNIPFNGLGAAMDLTTDRLICSDEGCKLVREIMTEVIEIAKAQGITFPEGLIDQQIAYTRTMGAYKSSMQIDRQENRPLEVEAILGLPLETGKRLGIPCQKLENLCQLVRVAHLSQRVSKSD